MPTANSPNLRSDIGKDPPELHLNSEPVVRRGVEVIDVDLDGDDDPEV